MEAMMYYARLLLVVTLTLFVAAPVAAATFGELEGWCAPDANAEGAALCTEYLRSELDLLASPDATINGGTRACVPAGEDRGRIIDLLRSYARAHPASRKLSSTTGLGLALNGHFPCKR
jgi:hypothetical protein